MSIDWLLANAAGEDAASNGDWWAAERHFQRAVEFSKGDHPQVHLVSLIDHAIALRMVRSTRESLQIGMLAQQFALESFGADSRQYKVVSGMYETLAEPQLPFNPRELYMSKITGKLKADTRFAEDHTYHSEPKAKGRSS